MNIVVDAILITGPQGNNTLKAICHATGCDDYTKCYYGIL